jgi:4-hydroxyphenylpyruvate dioxygenase-like putative hemolysin
MHHVVFAVQRDEFDRAGAMFTELGCEFLRFELDDVALQIQLDWLRGIEIVTPSAAATVDDCDVAAFLEGNGPGVYSVVLRVSDAPTAEQLALRYGGTTHYSHHRDVDGHALDEAMMTVLGLPLTFLSTELP